MIKNLDSETGLYYYRARYFDTATGWFISEDPIGFAGGDVNFDGYLVEKCDGGILATF
ncbi:RHS repeat-associated core domain-containing protein [Crocosphaera sp. XPORK-15E]|uniref:RHS repeat-associated core domain-containing protein n=1 Tax=Crocosphaera sp. XPORK-15E TaxID=3110247 RepID=UPI003A4E5A69